MIVVYSIISEAVDRAKGGARRSMNELLLAAAGLAALGAASWVIFWVVREWSLSPSLRVTIRQLEQARDGSLPAGPVARCKPVSTKLLQKADQAVELLRHGCLCSEVILATYGPALGISRGEALEFCLKYGKQLNLEQTCGAVTGACV